MKRNQILKISISFLVIVFILVVGILYGREVGILNNNIADTKVDLGTSEIYSEEDLQAAADVILNEIKTWDSVKEVYTVSYCGDEISSGNLDYCNILSDTEQIQCVVFESSFHTVKLSAESDGFNTDSRYDDWQWYLARTVDGEWKLLTWGY